MSGSCDGKKLYVVALRHEVVVLAESDSAAEAEALQAWRLSPGDCGEPEVEQAVRATMACQLPDGWGLPFGSEPGDDRWAADYLPARKP